MDQFWSAPPVTRTLSALTFIQSALVYAGFLNGYYIVFQRHLLIKLLPEVWRLVTPFMVTRPKLFLFLDVYFMYTYGSSLETGSPRLSGPGDFFVYTMFVALIIMLTAGCLLGSVTFTSALILAFIYTFSQENRGRKTTFFVVQIPVEYLPWAVLAVTLVMAGWPAVLSDGMGIVAAHLYDFLTCIYPAFGGGQNYLMTPAFIRRFFSAFTPRAGYRAYGTAFQPVNQTATSHSDGWTSSFQGPWSRRGPGRRLGAN
ncbi:centromere/microtubule-binding protein Cbf5 [Aspergillus homomorphus CBS 101889]|uniref:Derlin n=1 Tax=Aspergillus homomorphus (strain CBS 101889) TaxID=1450537 RepID=A0A395HKM5_ASPHC|nr:centromere/microtubule-binding protein Cbf5 [Aspergillus homomorphus CBS 101889]RAL08377.1 centromere/microtubule-binding protein Cbf5 [Aspergillus homomorphus CBS 101889]